MPICKLVFLIIAIVWIISAIVSFIYVKMVDKNDEEWRDRMMQPKIILLELVCCIMGGPVFIVIIIYSRIKEGKWI